MKKILIGSIMVLLYACCQDLLAPYEGSEHCPNEHLMRMYEETYVPWAIERFPECDPLFCSEWFIYIDQFYRDMTPAPLGGYVPPEDIVCYFYDEGTDRLYDLIFRNFCQ